MWNKTSCLVSRNCQSWRHLRSLYHGPIGYTVCPCPKGRMVGMDLWISSLVTLVSGQGSEDGCLTLVVLHTLIEVLDSG